MTTKDPQEEVVEHLLQGAPTIKEFLTSNGPDYHNGMVVVDAIHLAFLRYVSLEFSEQGLEKLRQAFVDESGLPLPVSDSEDHMKNYWQRKMILAGEGGERREKMIDHLETMRRPMQPRRIPRKRAK